MSKIALRRAWFQVHKWIGLTLAALIIPISLTGSALVWHEPIERMLHPEWRASGPMALPATAYADAARAVLQPGERPLRLEHDGAVTVTAVRSGKGMPQRAIVYLDPATAHVLGVERNTGGLFRAFHDLHGSLFAPGPGRAIVGWLGVAMLISSLTGLWLWWPLSGSVTRGFRWKRHRNTDTNLHHLVGFWASVPLFVLSLSGGWIAAPQMLPGQNAGPRPPRAAPLASPAITLERAVSIAASTGGSEWSIDWPTDQNWVWLFEPLGTDGTTSPLVIDATTGTAQQTVDWTPPPDTLARTMRRIHDGTGTGFVWQLILFLTGILPAILGVTGIIMWWRARHRRRAIGR